MLAILMEGEGLPSRSEWDEAIEDLTAAWPEVRAEVLAQVISPKDHFSHWIKAKEIDSRRAIEQKIALQVEKIGMTLTADGTITKKDVHVVPTPNVIDAETYMADREALNQKYTELKRIELVPIYEDHTNCLDKEDIAQEDFKAEDSTYYEEWGYTD